MQKILYVAHCFLNDSTKLKNQDKESFLSERSKKRELLKKLLDDGTEIVQLPCPEFHIYGCNRWGHIAPQFDTPFFRDTARALLNPYLVQIREYMNHPDKFQIIGVMGINGSPSCGVDFTCGGDWGGELSSNPELDKMIDSAKKVDAPGIFMDEFKKLLTEHGIDLPFLSL